MNKVAIVILNYNSSADCEKCVNFLLKQTDIELYIILVDNCSSIEETEKVESFCKKNNITFIRASENRGYSAGNNIGLKHAVELGYEYVVIANPDMEFHQTNYLSEMVNTMKNDSSIAVCASDIIDIEGRHQNPFYVNSYWDDLFLEHLKRTKTLNQDIGNAHFCKAVHGCCMLLRSEFLKKVNYLDEKTFLYCEERILSQIVYAIGMRIYYFPDVQAVHHHIKSEKGNYKKRLRLMFVSRKYFYKNYTRIWFVARLLLYISWRMQLYLIPLLHKKGIFTHSHKHNKIV